MRVASPPPLCILTFLGATVSSLVGLALALLPAAPALANDADPDVAHETPVTPMDRDVRPGHNSPQFAVHPDDESFIALANRLDAPGFGCALHLSGDGGESWAPTNPVPEIPEGAHSCYGPEIAFGPDGTLYYLFVGLSGGGNTPMGVFLTTSHDNGRSFGAPRQLLGEFKFGLQMAIDRDAGDRGRLHLAWIEAISEVSVGSFGPPPNPIMSAHSDDGGNTFSDPVRVSDEDRDRVVAPTLALGPDGEVHIAYYDLLDDARDYQGVEGPVWDGNWEIVLATSEDRGESFDDGSVVDDAIEPHERVMVIFTQPPPALAIGPEGQVCLAWTDARHGRPDILARCRPADGEEFRDAAQVNDTPTGNDHTQELPQLSFAESGRLDAIFYDRRHSSDDDHQHVFFASSTDGGQTFSENVQVTSQASFVEIGQRYLIPSAQGMFESGDRLGLHSTETHAVAAWADMRNSRPRTTAQDIFTATLVDLPEGGSVAEGGWSAVPSIGFPSLVIALLAGGLLIRRRLRSDERTSSHEAGWQGASEAQ